MLKPISGSLPTRMPLFFSTIVCFDVKFLAIFSKTFILQSEEESLKSICN